jgi:hypothetical protein
MFFTEDSVNSLLFYLFYFHKVICSSCTLDMKRYHALTVLTLYAGPFIFNSTYDALQIKALVIDLI